MHRIIRLVASIGLALMVTASFVFVSSAHEHREVADGQYEITIGFLNEPAYQNQQNGLDLRVATVEEDGEGTPVEGLEDTLTAVVRYGDQEMELDISPVWNTPGSYRAIFFPTAVGAYTFHITGEIDGNEIDEEFTSGPETFSEVEPIEPLQFPKVD